MIDCLSKLIVLLQVSLKKTGILRWRIALGLQNTDTYFVWFKTSRQQFFIFSNSNSYSSRVLVFLVQYSIMPPPIASCVGLTVFFQKMLRNPWDLFTTPSAWLIFSCWIFYKCSKFEISIFKTNQFAEDWVSELTIAVRLDVTLWWWSDWFVFGTWLMKIFSVRIWDSFLWVILCLIWDWLWRFIPHRWNSVQFIPRAHPRIPLVLKSQRSIIECTMSDNSHSSRKEYVFVVLILEPKKKFKDLEYSRNKRLWERENAVSQCVEHVSDSSIGISEKGVCSFGIKFLDSSLNDRCLMNGGRKS